MPRKRKCIVPNCDFESTNEKRALFSATEANRQAWSKILHLDLKKTHFVCEKHFNPDDIHQGSYYGTKGGEIIINVSTT